MKCLWIHINETIVEVICFSSYLYILYMFRFRLYKIFFIFFRKFLEFVQKGMKCNKLCLFSLLSNFSALGKYVGALCNNGFCEPYLTNVYCDPVKLACNCKQNFPVLLGRLKGCDKRKYTMVGFFSIVSIFKACCSFEIYYFNNAFWIMEWNHWMRECFDLL